MINEIIILVSVLLGWFLRDLQTKVIQDKAEKIKKKLLPNKVEVLEWKEPKTQGQENEEQAIRNMGDSTKR